MSLEALPDWLLPLWRGLLARRERLPHALLFCGPAGSGKRLFAEHLARALLCRQPDSLGFSCGNCPDCSWVASLNHPDFFTLVPAADESAEAEESLETSGKKEKAKSQQIVIDQIRGLQASLEVGAGGHSGGRRVVLVDPAEAMNQAAANALLKALEEPVGSTVYLMLSNAPRRLLPTIRSRCQVLDFPRPAYQDALSWMQQAGVTNPALLGFASGLPMAARELANGPLALAREQFASDLASMQKRDPLRLAADWENRLKAKGAAEAGFNMTLLVAWLQRWLSDGARVAGGGKARFFAEQELELKKLGQGRVQLWLECYRELLQHRKLAQHPLNARLFLEEMTLSLYRNLFRS